MFTVTDKNSIVVDCNHELEEEPFDIEFACDDFVVATLKASVIETPDGQELKLEIITDVEDSAYVTTSHPLKGEVAA